MPRIQIWAAYATVQGVDALASSEQIAQSIYGSRRGIEASTMRDMFRFVYALAADEAADAKWAADGFIGIESAEPRDGLPRIGVHGVPGDAGELAYLIHAPAGPDAVTAPFGKQLKEQAERTPETMVLVESGGAFSTPHQLWGLMEAAHHPRVKVSLDLDAVRAAGLSAAVMVPTINLRIGLIRVRTAQDDLTDYARRLAGIGFEGFVVIDPPPGPNRGEAAEALAAIFRDILPKKPVKKVPAAKPVQANPA
ncbi:MAG: hypothetical protein JWM57_632 [Phycisphaerales bacterium]|nr:hypothetical protein [Phycisphaerales bacterium]